MTTKPKKSETVGTILVNNQEFPVCFFDKLKLVLSVNNKMLSYKASVEFDFNQESSDFDLLEMAEVIQKVFLLNRDKKVKLRRLQLHFMKHVVFEDTALSENLTRNKYAINFKMLC